MTQLSTNFSLKEFIKSDTATRKGLDNTPSPEVVANLQKLVDNVVQLLAGDNLRMISKKLIQVIGTCIFNDKDFTRFLEWSYMSVYQLKSKKTNSHLFFQNNLSLEC